MAVAEVLWNLRTSGMFFHSVVSFDASIEQNPTFVIVSTTPIIPGVAQIRVVADETETAVNWAEMDFRLSKVRDGTHKDCWLMERVIITDSGYDPK